MERFLYEWDWDEAERHFQVAIRCGPGYPIARVLFGHLLIALGKADEGGDQLIKVLELDPVSVEIAFWAADLER